MNKYYAKVQTDIGVINLIVKSDSEDKAREDLAKDYNIKSIISISNQPSINFDSLVKSPYGLSAGRTLSIFPYYKNTKRFAYGN